MSEKLLTKAIISGPITPDEARTLNREMSPDSPASNEVMKKIGAIAHEDAVALVVKEDESGNAIPSHFVGLAPHDFGVVIDPVDPANPEGSRLDPLNIPTPEAAHAHLIAKAEQTSHQ
jgi:hypothetical protein